MVQQPRIVRIATADGIYLHGYFQPGHDKRNALLHIHGFEGNFYENHFLDLLGEKLKAGNFTWLPVNTRGNGKDTDFNTVDGGIRRIGARYELLEDAHLDIDAWVEFLLDQGYEKIVLMGHSLGTYKSVRYLFEGKHKDKIGKLILLAPFDKKALIQRYTKTPLEKLLVQAEDMVKQRKGDELITSEFDEISVSYKTYISWYKQDDLGRCFEFCSKDYDFPILQKIAIPTKIIAGADDEFFHASNPGDPDEAMTMVVRKLKQGSTLLIPNAVHSFAPHEDVVAIEVSGFLQKG